VAPLDELRGRKRGPVGARRRRRGIAPGHRRVSVQLPQIQRFREGTSMSTASSSPRIPPPRAPSRCPFESKKARGILPPTSLPTPPHPRLSLTLPSSSTRRRRSSSERTRTPCWRPSATACPPASSAWNASWASTSPSARGTTHGDSPWTQTRSRGACTSSSTTTPCTEERAASAAAVPRCAPGRA
jgi:hypothetical protein